METLTMKYPEIGNYIGGKYISSRTNKFLEIHSPLDGSLLSKAPLSSRDDLNDAVIAAKKAFETWSKTPIKDRVQIFYRYKMIP